MDKERMPDCGKRGVGNGKEAKQWRGRLPSILVIDSQSVKNSPTATEMIGTDGGKLIKGRKRMLVVDSTGNLLAVKVFEANRHGRPCCIELVGERTLP